MPELPEVETIRQGLTKQILKKSLVKIEVFKTNLVKSPLAVFHKTLHNNQFVAIERIGKLLIWHLKTGDLYLLIHLKMTGQLIYVVDQNIIAGGHNLPKTNNLPNKYSHIIVTFQDGSHLYFNDLRQFGYWQLVDQKSKDAIVKKFGIEPKTKNFTFNNFLEVLAKRSAPIKSVLLNQQLIAGIGNIYADEICFRAQILPTRKTNTLTRPEKKKLYQACEFIITKAIKHRGTTFSDYRDSKGEAGNFVKYLKVYGRKNLICLRCHQSKIKKIKASGRGTHYCPNCQK